MRILVVGATGTIGTAVADDLAARHEVLRAGHRQGDLRVDITDTGSIEQLLLAAGPVDAVVSCAGQVHIGPLVAMSEAQMRKGLDDKLAGQLNLARLSLSILNDGGSITLSSGLASRHHRPGWSVLSTVNAALETFARAAALDLPRGIRINVVSPGAVRESLLKWNSPAALLAVATPAAEVARAYVQAVEGTATGTVIDAGGV